MYLVQIRTHGTLVDAEGKSLEIIPGMVAEVDIIGEKRTVLEYVIEPVLKVKDKAFTERGR